MRNADQRRIDAALLLALWDQSVEAPLEDAGDKLWQMKLAFLAALDLAQGRVHGVGLSFYRWTWGPLSNEVYDAWDDLTASDLLHPDEHFVFTRRGLELARAFYQEVVCDERNIHVRESIDRVAAAWHGPPTTRTIMDHVYGIEIVPCGDAGAAPVPIQAVPSGVELLEPLSSSEAARWFTVEPGWRETLALVLKSGTREPIEAAIKDYRAGRIVAG